MSRMRNQLSWFLLAGGVFLLLKGGSSLYFFARPAAGAFEPSPASAVSVEHSPNFTYPADSFDEGAYIARLRIPRLQSTVHLVEGTSSRALRLGPGHLAGTPLPGRNGNSVIAGHRDTHFRVLKDVEIGDEIVVERGARQFVYRVTETRIVEPTNTESLRPTSNATLTLITCYPFRYLGPAPERYVVRAVAD